MGVMSVVSIAEEISMFLPFYVLVKIKFWQPDWLYTGNAMLVTLEYLFQRHDSISSIPALWTKPYSCVSKNFLHLMLHTRQLKISVHYSAIPFTLIRYQ